MRAIIALLAALSAAAVSAQAPAPATPGPEHEMLKKQIGVWDCAVKGPGGESKGTSKVKAINNGLWMQSNFDCDLGGMKFQGHGLDTYDATKKKYVSVWTDSMSASPVIFEGDYDPVKKTLTLTAKEATPGPDGKHAKMKTVTTYVDDDHMNFAMHMDASSPAEPMMTIQYARRKTEKK